MLGRLIDWSLANRFLVVALALFLAGTGWWSMRTTPIDALPDLSDVQVIVHADWPGRDPETVEDIVTYPIASRLLNVARVRDVRGFSFFGLSFVYAIFEDGTDPYWARSRVLENLSQVQRDLPNEVVPALGPDASGLGWVYLYTLEDTAGELDLGELRELQDTYVRYQLESVPGVAEVASLGGAVRQIQVTVDPRSLAAYGIPLQRVRSAIQRSNEDVGGRVVELAETEFMVRGRGRLESLEDLRAVALGTDENGTPVHLFEVADVQYGPDIKRGIAEKNGTGEVVAGIVTMRYGENALEVISAVKERIRELQPGLPAGVVLRKAYDRSRLIEQSIATLRRQLLEELAIVALVCVLFLWHARSALVAAVVLPLGILTAFGVMRLFGVSANIMSLGGIAVAVGAMIDAAVVMVENLHKHKEAAKPEDDHWELVRRASREVGPALFFSLAVITVSFLPVFVLEDQAGRLFKPLAFTKTCAMASAAVLAVVLMPVLMGFFVQGKVHRESANPISRAMIAIYLPVLRFALKNRWLSIGVALLLLGLTVIPYSRLGTEFMPPIREGDALAMPTTLPGISSTEARRTLQMQDRLMKGFPEVEVVLGKIGRANTPLDPAPLSMVETHITLLSEDEWPARVIERDWLERRARDVLDEARQSFTLGPLPASANEAAEQTARMSAPVLSRWIRGELIAGRAMDELGDELVARIDRQLAQDLFDYLNSQGVPIDADAETFTTSLVESGSTLLGDEIPLRRTTFEELLKEEMHGEIQIPGMPNWWLMPIETRIGMLTTGMRGNVGLKIYGRDLSEMSRLATDLEALLQNVPGTSSVIAERAVGGHYLDIDVDRDACARFGVAVGDVQDVIESGIGGMPVTTVLQGRARIPVSLRYPRELRDDPERLGRTLVTSSSGVRIPLVQLADISLRDGPPMIKSENGQLLTNVPVDLEPGADVGGYVERAQSVIDEALRSGELVVPTGTSLRWSGQYQLMQEVKSRLGFVVPLTLAILFVLIYFNTKNLTETGITMITLPFALIGGVWFLDALDYDLSVAVVIGFLALAGLAAETAILMHVYLDLAYKKHSREGVRLAGAALEEAIVEGAVLRVRPKMMTVVTTILALVPILWTTGAGAGPMKRLAAPMIGGLLTSTLHTLILIPVYYAMFQEWRARRQPSERRSAS